MDYIKHEKDDSKRSKDDTQRSKNTIIRDLK